MVTPTNCLDCVDRRYASLGFCDHLYCDAANLRHVQGWFLEPPEIIQPPTWCPRREEHA